MKRHVVLVTLLWAQLCVRTHGQVLLPENRFATLTREHTDGLCVLYNEESVGVPLSLVAWQREAGLDLPTNQVLFVVKEQARLTLPSGTPFGDTGAAFWILPQSQNPELLYLGIDVSRVPFGVFAGPLSIQLVRLEGPGYFMVWQATAPGQFTLRINSRDGIDENDAFLPIIGSHEHFNWGFSAPGIYCATFQASGQRPGVSTAATSPESTFVFQVLPLPPATNFPTWQKHFWPPGFNPPTTHANGNPDADAFDNLREYAFGLSPTNTNNLAGAPLFSFVTTNEEVFGALTFSRYQPALDLNYIVEASGALPAGWETLSHVHAVQPGANGLTGRVTMRDDLPASNVSRRFYRLTTTLY